MLRPRTIVGQLIAGSVLVQVLVFSTFLAVSIRRQFRQAEKRDRARLRQQASILAGLLAEPLTTGDNDMLDHVMRSIQITVSIRSVRLTDATGRIIGASGTDAEATLSARERSLLPLLLEHPEYREEPDARGRLDEGVQPVMSGGAVRGVVWVLQDRSVTNQSPAAVLEYVLLYAGVALVGNLLLVWAVTSTLARPLRALRESTLQLQHDSTNLSGFPLPVRAHNEAGALTASFNAMVQEIGRQRQGTQDTLKLLDALLSSAPIGFAFYDRSYRYVRINERLAHLHGIPAEAHPGKRLRDLLPEDAGPQALAASSEALIEQVYRSGEPLADQEISGVLPGDDRARTFQVSYYPVHLGDELRWVGVIATEITERKRAEEAMRRSEKLAAAGRLAASIAHEINNPLEAVTNLLYLLRHHGDLNEQSQKYAAMAQGELMRIGEITQQTLRFYRQSTAPADVRISDVLRSVLVLHGARLQSPPVDVRLEVADNAIFFGYPGELRQLFVNLVGNALDAMPKGGVLHLRAREHRRKSRRGLRITIADTGVGMPESVLRRIFEPFFTTKESTGTGLGLWVSEEVLSKHHGSVQVRSRQASSGRSSGTIFRLFFPLDGVPRGPRIVTSAAEVLADHIV